MELALIYFVTIQTILLPIYAGLYIGIRNERKKQELLFKKAMTVVSGYRRRYARY